MPDATPRPLTAEDVEQRLLADVAEARAQLAEITAERDRLRTDLADAEKADDDLVSEILRNMREEDGDDIAPGALCVRYVRSLEAGREKLLAANQRWAETLGDVQQRHAEVKRERDAHKLRAGHYEGLWRAEHGLPPDGTDNLARDRDLAASVRAVIARYKADDVNALTAFADIMDAAGDTARAPAERDPVAAERERIRQLAIETRAVTVSPTGRMMPFEELLRHSPEENAELLLQVADPARASVLADPETMAAIAEGERDLRGEARDDT